MEAVHVVLALHIWQRAIWFVKGMYNVEKPNYIHALSTGARNAVPLTGQVVDVVVAEGWLLDARRIHGVH